MQSKSTIAEKDMGDTSLNELASNDVVFSVDINQIHSSAPVRPQRSKKADGLVSFIVRRRRRSGRPGLLFCVGCVM